MFKPLALLLLLAGAAPPVPSNGITIDERWEVAGDWDPQFGALTCMLARDYVDGSGHPARVLWRPDPVGSGVDVMIERAGRTTFPDPAAGRRLQSGEGKMFTASAMTFNMASGNTMLFITTSDTPWVEMTETQKERMAALKEGETMEIDETALYGEELSVRVEHDKWIAIPTPGLAKAKNALEACREGLQRRLGIAPGQIEKIVKHAAIEEHGFSAQDYPSGMLRKAGQGRPGLFYWVNEVGRAEDCHVIETSGYAVLDDALCAKFEKRAKFTPARDKDGANVREPQFRRVTFRM